MIAGDQRDLELAVIGMAGRFPGADSIAAFWENLRAGVESIRDLSEEELRAAGVDATTRDHPSYVRRAADVRDIDRFDASFFGFTPREAELTDPQFRVFLEDVWAALEDAGHSTDRHDLRIGVFVGGSTSTYAANVIASIPRAARIAGAFQISIGNERDYLATQVSYRLDLRGPSFVVQTACSTSLVAIHLACQSLLAQECDVAIAGGVSLSIPQTEGYLHEEGDIASPDGRCRAFDADAAGCIKGNGSGVVVLRRLRDALEGGDSIRAIVKGTAINNDGNAKVGFTAPGIEGQVGVIREALAVAAVDPATVSYIEAHGTATTLGDPIEVAALAEAFGSEPRAGRCALGSVKTNIGHLDAAAGVAGFIKTVLALQHREIPPSLHYRRPNPKIDFEHAPFFVNAELRRWDSVDGPRRAGVSSFGIGGTNAHVILEEAPRIEERSEPADGPSRGAENPQVLVLSASTDSSLAKVADALAARLEEWSNHDRESRPAQDHAPSLADIAYTLQMGRRRLAFRRSLVAATVDDAIRALREQPRSTQLLKTERRGAEVAFLFPGQGAQHAGMCRALYRTEPVFRTTVDRCCDVLQPLLQHDLRALLLAEKEDASAEERLRHTSLTQPALFVVEYALAQLWIALGIRPAAMAGHSVGEYVAACLAGVFSLEDALALVAERGRLMGSLPPGAMLAVQLPERDLVARLAGHPALSVAVINAPESCVTAGPEQAIDRFADELSHARVPYRRLNTSHAFHSAMMDPVLGEFEARVRRVRLSPPILPFQSNVTGTWITAAQAVDPAYWAKHLRQTVRFADNLAELATDSSRVLLEAGPGTTLTTLARHAGASAAVASMPPPRSGGDDAAAVLEALGQLWCGGVDIDWTLLHTGRSTRRIPLPTYPFERQRYWVDEAQASTESAKHWNLAEWFFLPGWKRSALVPEHGALAGATTYLLLDDESELSDTIAHAAASRGARVVRVRIADATGPGASGGFAATAPLVASPDGGNAETNGRGKTRTAVENELQFEVDPSNRDAFAALFRKLEAADALPDRILHLWCADPTRLDPDSAQERGLFALLHLLQALGHTGSTTETRLLSVARGLFDVTGEAVECPERATLVGIARVAPQEYPSLRCRLLDIGGPLDETARVVLGELDAIDREPVVAWRGGHRWIPSYERVSLSEAPERGGSERLGNESNVNSGGYLFTGGQGAIEVALTQHLAAKGFRRFGFLDCAQIDAPALLALRSEGVEIASWPARAQDPAALRAAISEARTRFGGLAAVFLSAHEIGGGMIQLKDHASVERVLAPRLIGARVLADSLRENERLYLFSSAISVAGVFGQVDYCAAAAFLDAFAQSRRHTPGPRLLSIDWGVALWDRWQATSGAGAEALSEQLRAIQDSIGITVAEGVDAWTRVASLDTPQVIVTTQDLTDLVNQSIAASLGDILESVGGAKHRGGTSDGDGNLESDTERRVARVWNELLGVSSISRSDNFFDLGGNSLLAIQLASQLRKMFDIDLGIASLFESADLASLAAAVDRALDDLRAGEEIARLLDEIEQLSDHEVRAELERGVDAEATE